MKVFRPYKSFLLLKLHVVGRNGLCPSQGGRGVVLYKGEKGRVKEKMKLEVSLFYVMIFFYDR